MRHTPHTPTWRATLPLWLRRDMGLPDMGKPQHLGPNATLLPLAFRSR